LKLMTLTHWKLKRMKMKKAKKKKMNLCSQMWRRLCKAISCTQRSTRSKLSSLRFWKASAMVDNHQRRTMDI
jgi:hypothetical protein